MRRLLPAAFLIACCATAHAAPCTTGAACNFAGILHILYIAAAILAVVLIIVIVLAVLIYRRNKRAELDS